MVRCCQCAQITTRGVFDSLANISYLHNDSRRVCVCCARLNTFAFFEEEAAEIKEWLYTGKLPFYEKPPIVGFSAIMYSLRTRRIYMEERIARVGGDPSQLVTTNELYQLCQDSNFTCAITGNKIYFNPRTYNRNPYWALSLDHILPIKYYKKNPRTWSKHNIQLLAAVVNEVKGHVPDYELLRWYTQVLVSKANVL